jgi:hypothetical protein
VAIKPLAARSNQRDDAHGRMIEVLRFVRFDAADFRYVVNLSTVFDHQVKAKVQVLAPFNDYVAADAGASQPDLCCRYTTM